MAADLKKRKKSQYFKIHAKKSKLQFNLEPGIKGFFCTCNKHERECLREAYNILNQYADQLYGEEVICMNPTNKQTTLNTKTKFKDSDDEDSSSNEDDIQNELAREISALKEVRNVAPHQRRFQAVESGAANCLFLRTTVDDPVTLVETILKDIEVKQQQKTKFLLRLIPIETTCKAWPDDIKCASKKLLEKYFKGDPKTFCVVFKRHNNTNVPRDEVIQDIASDIKNLNPGHRVDMKNPDLSVIVEVIRGIVCLAVVPMYYHFRKYNLIEVSRSKVNELSKNSASQQSNGSVSDSTDTKSVKCIVSTTEPEKIVTLSAESDCQEKLGEQDCISLGEDVIKHEVIEGCQESTCEETVKKEI